MSEVSGRAWAFFVQAARHGLVDLDDLLRDSPLTRRALEARAGRIRWDDWAELVLRFAAPLTRAEQMASGRHALTEDFLGGLLRIIGVFTNVQDVYRLGMMWTGPSMYRSMAFTYDAPTADTVHVTIALRPRFRPCEPWFLSMVGVFEAVPALFGLPPAHVAWTVTPTSGDYRITLPARTRARDRLRRVVEALRAPHAVTEALVEQQRQVTVQLEALRDAETGYAALLDTLPTAIALFDDARVVYANPAMARVLALTPHELEGERLARIVHADDLAAIGGAGVTTAFRLVRRDGTIAHLEGVILADVRFHGRALRGLCANDVTARVEMEGRLARSEELRRAMVEVMPDLLLRVQRDGRIVDELGGRELPLAVRAALGPGASLLELPLERPGVAEAIAGALADGGAHTFEWSPGGLGGPTLEGRLVPLALEHDALVFVRDVSRRRDEQRQLVIAERMAAVGTLAAGVAHEINNPLAAVIGNLELLTEALDDGLALTAVEDVQAMVRDATEGARRVTRIVAAMKAFSGGRAAVTEPAPTDVEAVIDSALVLIAQQIGHRARLVRERGQPPRALASADGLTQVMVNLLINAIQAIPEGQPERHAIRIRTALEHGEVVIEVHDTGVGITPAVLPRIFDPFFTTKPIGEGTGLGLAISHRVVREAGGTLTATSQPGRGTMLRVALRPATREPEAIARPRAPVAAAARRARIVVVDDEPAVGRTLVRALVDHDLEIVPTSALALARLAQPPWPDLILCDLMLPGFTGAEVFERVCRATPVLADRFLFTTGGAFTPSTEAFVRAHAARVLVKPLDLGRLREVIAAAIARTG